MNQCVHGGAPSFHAPGAYHNRGSVLAFADGHLETHRLVKPRLNRSTNGIHDAPIHSTDSQWMRNRMHHALVNAK